VDWGRRHQRLEITQVVAINQAHEWNVCRERPTGSPFPRYSSVARFEARHPGELGRTAHEHGDLHVVGFSHPRVSKIPSSG